jgi:predicted heme/steroid binding protein
MKKLFIIVIGILICSQLNVSCKKSIAPALKNSIAYNNTEYDVNSGLLEFYGKIVATGTGNNIDLILISSGLVPVVVNGVIDSIQGTGNGINFEMFTTGITSLDVGNYTFDANKTGNPGTFDFGNTILNFTTTTQQGIELDINSGTVTIKQNGSVYELTFSCTAMDGKSVTGYFKGSLQYFDNSSIVKSAKIKKQRKW